MNEFAIFFLALIGMLVICACVDFAFYYKPMNDTKKHINFSIEMQKELINNLNKGIELNSNEILELHHRISKLEQGSNGVEN